MEKILPGKKLQLPAIRRDCYKAECVVVLKPTEYGT